MKPKRNSAYIDGSFDPKTGRYGCGGFIIDNHGVKHYFLGADQNPEMSKMRNVAGEIMGALYALFIAFEELHMDEITLCYDYEGIANWALGLWKCRNKHSKHYVEQIKMWKNLGKKINFSHIKGHSGNQYNDTADRLAKAAVKMFCSK